MSSRYRDERDLDGRGDVGRTRSRSPVRRGDERDRDSSKNGWRNKDSRDYDSSRDLPYGGREESHRGDRRRDDHRSDRYERDRPNRAHERNYEPYSDDRERQRQQERANPNNDPTYRPARKFEEPKPRAVAEDVRGGSARGGRGGGAHASSGSFGGRGGYGGGNAYNDTWKGGASRERDYQSMDRRAIEEGRRKREEERAMGITYTEDGRVIDPRAEEREREERERQQEQDDALDSDDPEAQMAAMMGFGGFNTTKKKGVEQNVEGGANVHKERTWRQYMNRRGGFNRPLDKVKD